MTHKIYLDYNATTPLDPRVLDAMLPYFQDKFGNAASRSHAFGWAAEEGVETARQQVADLLGCSPKEIVFTSGATESDNIAVKGAAEMLAKKGRHIITCVTEHKAILDSCKYLESTGRADVTYLDVDAHGRVTVEQVAEAIRDDTILITLMAGNNEIGTIHPIQAIGALAREKGIWFHSDATQAIGKIPFDVNDMNVDIASLSGHKLYGPKGIGVLYVRRRNPRVRLTPVIHGGGHERGMRSGTLNVPGIVGIGEACRIAHEELARDAEHCRSLRDHFEQKIMASLDHVAVNGDPEHRLPNTTNLSFAFVEGESMIMGIPEVAVSSGSACTSASLEPSYVLRALGVGDDMAHSSIRFSFGRFSTAEEIDRAAEAVIGTVTRLREMSPLYELAQDGVDLSTIQWDAAQH